MKDEETARDLVQQVMLLTIQKLRGGAIREADQIGSFILGVSRTMAIDLKRRERRRERLRETFAVEPGVSEPTTARSTSIASRAASAASPNANG